MELLVVFFSVSTLAVYGRITATADTGHPQMLFYTENHGESVNKAGRRRVYPGREELGYESADLKLQKDVAVRKVHTVNHVATKYKKPDSIKIPLKKMCDYSQCAYLCSVLAYKNSVCETSSVCRCSDYGCVNCKG